MGALLAWLCKILFRLGKGLFFCTAARLWDGMPSNPTVTPGGVRGTENGHWGAFPQAARGSVQRDSWLGRDAAGPGWAQSVFGLRFKA